MSRMPSLLPEEIRRRARRAYLLFRKDPRHASLRFKKVDEESDIYSVRIGLGYRALGVMEGSTVIWFWIGVWPISHTSFLIVSAPLIHQSVADRSAKEK